LCCGFAKGLVLAKDLFEKHVNKFWSKYFGFALFAIALVLNFLCLGWMGSGAHIIEEITHFNNVWLLIACSLSVLSSQFLLVPTVLPVVW
jgi:hypothetical protein